MPPAGSSRAAGASTAPDRRQSARQGRTSVTRPTNYYARAFGRTAAYDGMDQTPPAANTLEYAPVLTHFTQAVDAFPKELIRHFSLFKEVEAKTHDPEREMQLLLDTIAQLPVPTVGQRHAAEQAQPEGEDSAMASASSSMMVDATTLHQKLSEALFPSAEQFNNLPPEEQADMKKRRLFYQLRHVIHSMLPALDEKLVVLTSAKGTKDKALARMNHSYAQLDSEISAESRYGSLTHWAYADKEEKKKGGTERSRREVASANNLAAAAQHVHDADSIAAKSDARRDAVTTNKRSRHQHVDSDFDDRPVKKTQKRKPVAAESATAGPVGLGITNNGPVPPGKRKKTEKALQAATAAAPPMERSLSGALQAAASGGRGVTSPRATPGAENTTKRKPRAAPAPAQRKRVLPVNSPPPASSPLASTFAMSKATGGTTERPTSSRARKNSNANSVASAAQEPAIGPRPSTSHSVQQVPPSNVVAELEQVAGVVGDNISPKGTSTPQEAAEPAAQPESSNLKHEEQEGPEPEPMDIDVPAPAPASIARAGRTSKTATPVVGTFAESTPMARSRSTRNANNGNSNSQPSSENNSTTTGVVSKRGHKKSAQSTTNATVATPTIKAGKETVPSGPPSTASSVAPEPDFSEGGEEGDDEPRYCYCNEISYGSMIACDNEECPREWFHLRCVGMEKLPGARTKWFCSDECREANARANTKGKGGRPGSSRQ